MSINVAKYFKTILIQGFQIMLFAYPGNLSEITTNVSCCPDMTIFVFQATVHISMLKE